MAQPYLKTTFQEVWEYAGNELTEMSKNRFRTPKDYTLELFKTWQICRGKFIAYNTYQDTKMFPLVLKSKQAIEAIREQAYLLVCINDSEYIMNFNKTMEGLKASFESILQEQSSFEL